MSRISCVYEKNETRANGEQPVVNLLDTFSLLFAIPMTKKERASLFHFVAVEYLSRWLIAKAATSQMAGVAIKVFEYHILGRFGSISSIRSDRGLAFNSSAWRCMLNQTGTKPITTAEYLPPVYGRTEQMIHAVKRARKRGMGEQKGNGTRYFDE